MKVKDLVSHSHLVSGQYIEVQDTRNLRIFSSQDYGRYSFGPRDQEHVLNLTVTTFEPTSFGLRIFVQ